MDAMANGGELHISASRNGRYSFLEVEDNGCGIGAKEMPYVFDPFFTTKTNGTGLGLSVVHGIIKEHGGKIHIDSLSGHGTKVRISLPIS